MPASKRKTITVTCVDCGKKREAYAGRAPARCKACAIKAQRGWSVRS